MIVWSLALVLTIEDRSIYIIGGVGAFVAAIFAFIFPSMIYFRLGVVSDFQSIPIFGFIPNRLFMNMVQILGILLIVGNIAEFAYFLAYEM
jgi:transketolase C-terminal domain/subunit